MKVMRKMLAGVVIFSLVTGWFYSGWPQIWSNPAIPPEINTVEAADPQNGRADFITAHDPHTYWELNSTNLGTNFGHDATGNDDNTNVGAGDISTQDGYEGMNNQNDPPASGDFDVMIVTDSAWLMYIPADMNHGTVYGLWHNGGGTNAQGAFARATATGVEIACSHNNATNVMDILIEEIPDASLPGWFAIGCQFASNGGTQSDMGLWVDGVLERSGTRVNDLDYGSGDPDFGNNSGNEPDASDVIDPASYSGGDWGTNNAINGSGILIANFAADNPTDAASGDNSPGAGDDFYTDYYDMHNVSPSPGAPTFYNDDDGSNQITFNNSLLNDDTPTFRIAATDPEGDGVDYGIEIDDDPDFGSPNWYEYFNNGGSHYTSGSQVNLTMSTLSGISNGTTYYVRASSTDPTGSGTYGHNSSGTWSFTYTSTTGDPEWHQTTDEQFDTDTLSSTQTTGSDSVNLSQGYSAPAFETGQTTVDDSLDWTTINFEGSYASVPVVFVTPVTANNCEAAGTCVGNSTTADTGGMYPIPVVRNVTASSFDISMCVDGGNATCESGVSAETFDWFAFDVDDADNYDWIEVGTTTNVSTDGNSTSQSYSTGFSSTPDVWTQAQTYSQGGGIGQHAWVIDKSTASFNYRGCVISSASDDDCDNSATNETFGYVAIDTTNENFQSTANFQSNSASISNSEWAQASFSPTYSSTPRVMVTQSSTGGEGGDQDPKYAWARDVATSGMNFRYCEQDGGTTCNTHNAEDVYWFAVKQSSSPSSGTIMSPAIDFDVFSATNSWDSVLFSTTETNGDVKLSVYYNNGADCDTIVPDGTLSGNSSGFDVSGGAIDISGLATSTYNRICLQATLTYSGGVPYLDDWTVTTTGSAGGGGTPAASGVSIDSDASAVTLTEGTTTAVSCAGTVTDSDGYADISRVDAFFFRTSVGTSTADDANTKYTLSGDSECVPSGGAGNSETYTCDFPVWYYADATDSGAPQEADDWTCEMWPFDSTATGTPATDTIEINSLVALSATGTIDYGTLDPNTDTGGTNQTLTITNTGNRDMDPQLSGSVMSKDSDTIPASSQEYAGDTFTYGFGTDLSGSATSIDLTLPQRTDAEITDTIYWGLGVPSGTPAGAYSGTNTLSASAGI